MFFLTKAVMPHFKKGGAIIHYASVTAYQGSPELLDCLNPNGRRVVNG
jgi:hypothetical protein